ncbi:hypothetical protein SAMN02745196_01109 [Clostridium collagenovorans DSM 3089]|uniref:ABC-2 family transporter protein n=1 Tax=Clostridium collagenovorans DSM 3089 TaxID=1121306 RepID=A0A1M5V4X2_9CLOT|nr:hypothetical protein [Clostridium collagenovorans]SHH70299.1 hypothetical protein SAMN02745196_01109 [Clostridium collagenovorans DSM 3089]
MLKFKRDWLWELKIIALVIIIIMFSIGVIAIVSMSINDTFAYVMRTIYEEFSRTAIGMLGFGPVCSLLTICPLQSKGKSNLSIAHLPYSKKQLFFKGVKSWIKFYPIIVIINMVILVVISPYLESKGFKFALELVINTQIIHLVAIAVMQIQAISAIIFYFANKKKLYVLIPSYILMNMLVITFCVLVIRFLNIYTARNIMWMLILALSLMIPSIILFMKSWRNIEKVS